MPSNPPAGLPGPDPAPDRQRRWRQLVLGATPAQRASVAITLGGLGGYAANLGLLWYCAATGLTDTSVAWPVGLGALGSTLFFYVVLRLGWSRGLRNPALPLPQMMVATTWNAVGYCITGPAHLGLLMPQALTVAYCVFSLREREVPVLQAFAIVLFGACGVFMCHADPALYVPAVEFGALAMLAAVMLMLTIAGTRVAELRRRERQQRDELALTLARIEQLASRDALTGLFNRRSIEALAQHRLERARRYGDALTLTLIDLDHFKRINDRHGHGTGDEVLRAFAEAAQVALEGPHTLGRWGGEEFVVLSDTDADTVQRLLSGLRLHLRALSVSTTHMDLRASFSAGIAATDGHEPIAHTLRRADAALYEAKAAGRATTRIAADAAPSLKAVQAVQAVAS
jgi:diguanylate cyclase (GGDEF)-like protein